MVAIIFSPTVEILHPSKVLLLRVLQTLRDKYPSKKYFKNWWEYMCLLIMLTNICIIEVYILKYYFESHLIKNGTIIDKQSSINYILWYLT